MASERISLPHTANDVVCEVRNEKRRTTLTFFTSDGKKLGSKTFISDSLNEDQVVDYLAGSNIDFTTFSALYDSASIIIKKVKKLPHTKDKLFSSDKDVKVEKKDKLKFEDKLATEANNQPLTPLKKEKTAIDLKDDYVPSYMKVNDKSQDEEEILSTLVDETIAALEEFDTDESARSNVGEITSDAGKKFSELLFEYKIPYSNYQINFFTSDSEPAEMALVFLENQKEIARKIISGIPSEDDAYNLIDEIQISENFPSMSLIYDVAEKIIHVCANKDDYKPKEPEPTEIEKESSPEKVSEPEETAQKDDIKPQVIDEAEFLYILKTGAILTELKIPYSHETSVKIYHEQNTGKFALEFLRGQIRVDQAIVDKTLDEDKAWEIFNSADIEFISMSVIYDAADSLLRVIQNPDEFQLTETSVIKEDEKFSEMIAEKEEITVDFDQFKEPNDIEPLMKAIKKSIGTDKPLLVAEKTIESMKKVNYKVYRQGAKIWILEFFDKKTGEKLSQQPFKLKEVNFDNVFSAVNNGIPQVSLSAVQDAAEYVFDVIKNLASRPADDLIFTQVIKHFENLIDKNAKSGAIDKAIELTEGLINKLEDLGNANGVAKFGIRMAQFYESQDRSADSAKYRLETIPKLIALADTAALREFVDNTIDLFSVQLQRHLDTAKVAVDFAEYVLRRKEIVVAMSYVRKASSYYKQAKLQQALADHNFRFGKLFLQLINNDEPEGFFESPVILSTSEDDKTDTSIEFDLLADEPDPFADLDEEESDKEASGKKHEELKESIPDKVVPLTENKTILEKFDIREESYKQLLEHIVELFQDSVDVFQAEKQKFELLDSLTEIILLFRHYKFVDQEVIFAEKGMKSLMENNQSDRALRLSLQIMNKVLVKDGNIVKGLEFFNQAIRIYYEKEELLNALDLSLNIVKKLVDFGDPESAAQYISFTNGLAEKVYPEPNEEAIDIYLKLAEHYMTLKLQNESIEILTNTLRFKKKNLKELLDFCHQRVIIFLEADSVDFSRDFVNAAIKEVGTNFEAIIQISEQYAADLIDFKYFDNAMQYINYGYQCTGSLADPLEKAGQLITRVTNKLLDSDQLEKPWTYINSLIPILKAYFGQTKKFGDAAVIFQKIVTRLIETGEYTEAITQGKDLAVYFQYNKEPLKAGDSFISIRDRTLDKVSIEISRELTDLGLKHLLDGSVDANERGVTVLNPLIDLLLEKGHYEDAYVYTVQTASYFENLLKFEEGSLYIKELRSKFVEKGQAQDANSLTSLMVRLYSQAENIQQAAETSYEWYTYTINNQQWESAFTFLMDTIRLYKKESEKHKRRKRKKKSEIENKIESLLQHGYKALVKEPSAEEEAKEVIEELIKFRKSFKKINDEQILDFYLETAKTTTRLKHFSLANWSMGKAIVIIKQQFPERFHQIVTEFITNLIESDLYRESQPYVSDLLSAYTSTDDPNIKYIRELLFYYCEIYLKANEVEIATRLVEVVLERIKGDSANIIRITMKFVSLLAEYRLTSRARSYIDSTVNNLFPVATDKTQRIAVGTIYEKFSAMVIKHSPELAIEYAYKAADLFQKIKNDEKFLNIYFMLATEIEDPETSLRILKRGTFKSDQSKIPFNQQRLLQEQLVLRSIETKSSNAKKDFQNILAKYEEYQLIDEDLVKFLREAFYRFVRFNYFDLFFTYIDYYITLAKGMATNVYGLKIQIQITARFYRKKKDKKRVSKLRAIYKELKEPDPSDELIKHFMRTGETILPEKPKIPEKEIIAPVVAEMHSKIEKEVVSKVSSEVLISQEPEAKIVSESPQKEEKELVEPIIGTEGFTSTEDDFDFNEISEAIDDKALSAALSSALSQLSEEMSESIDTSISSLSARFPQSPSNEILSEKSKDDSLESMYSSAITELGTKKENSLSKDSDQLESKVGVQKDPSVLEKEEIQEEKSLDDLFSSAISDLTNTFGSIDDQLKNIDKKGPDITIKSKDQKGTVLDLPDPTAIKQTKRKIRGSGILNINEEEIYLELTQNQNSLIKEFGFQDASSAWNQKLPDLLKQWKISNKEWEQISEKGNKDLKLQEILESK